MARRRLRWRRIALVGALLAGLAMAATLLLGPVLLRVYYRVDPLELILPAARRHHVSPYLVGAVIFTESRFREEARSEVGAVGLMQLMPETAEEMARSLEMADYDAAELDRPELNIELGTAYLAVLQDRFQDESMMLAAYNAGPTLAAQWSQEGSGIPYPETREFVASVRRHRDRLSRLYPKWDRP